jgi:subtilisin family serine protease
MSRLLVLASLLALLPGCVPADPAESAAEEPKLPDALLDALILGESPVALVRVDAAEPFASELPVAERAARWAARADSFLTRLPAGVRPVRTYAHMPVVVVRLDDIDSAFALADSPDVLSITPDVAHELFLSQSLPVIDQSTAESNGFTGAGTAVAVLDTGADYTHADLGSCTAVGTPGSCRVVYAADFATSDGSLDDNGHGTNVSAIVAAVAPDADIIALDVFRGAYAYSTDILSAIDWVIANQATYNIAAINMSLGSGGTTAPCVDVFTAGIQSARAAGVSVVVASGNNAYTNRISSPACTDEAISVGAVYDSNMGAVGWSGCSDGSTAVDKVTCFSNTAYFLDMLAPGALIAAGGYTMGGTSQAAPHVAGAIAVLRSADPTASVDDIEAELFSLADTVTDTRTGQSFPRLDIGGVSSADCVTGLSESELSVDEAGGSGTFDIETNPGCAWTVSSDQAWLTFDTSAGTDTTTVTWTADANNGAERTATVTVSSRTLSVTQEANSAPSGTVSINAGATGTRSTSVTLTLAATDATDTVSEMCVSNSSSCTAWQAYATSLAWTLSGSGSRTVYAWFRDSNGNSSAMTSDTIVVDTTAPRNGTVTATSGTGEVDLAWSGYSDSGAGVSSYLVVQATSATAPRNCTSGTVVYSGSDTSFTATGLTDGTTYAWRVCAVDGAGNTSTGSTTSAIPAPEHVAPVGTIEINAGDTYTGSRTATVTLSATDASGVSYACLSNTSTCSTWFAMTGSKTWSMSSGSGTRTVYGWFKDAYGNISSAVTDTIVLDATAPTNGTVTLSGTSGALTATWTGFSDAASGLASYKLVYGTSNPSSCSAGTVGYTGTGTSATLTGLTDGTTYYVRVCGVDNVGNTGTGATGSVIPAPEYTAPTGTIVLNSGDSWTRSRTVTAALSATDDTAVSSMCLSTSSSCTSYVTYATSRSVTLGSTAGTQTVYAYFKDSYGNVSVASTDTIGYDASGPSGGTLSATAGSGSVALSWSGITDSVSGIASYKVMYNAGTAPTSCSTGTEAYIGTSTAVTVSGLATGTSYGFRVCGIDNAGNTGSGVTRSATPL